MRTRGWAGCARCWRRWARVSDRPVQATYVGGVTRPFESQSFARRLESAGMARGVAEALADEFDGLFSRRYRSEQVDREVGTSRAIFKDAERRMYLRLGVVMGGAMALVLALLGALIAFQ